MKLTNTPEAECVALSDAVAAAIGGADPRDVLEVAVAVVVESAKEAKLPRALVNRMIDVMWSADEGLPASKRVPS